MTNRELDFICNSPLFSDWSECDAKTLLTLSSAKKLAKGDFLFTAGQSAEKFYLLTNGLVDITNKDGAAIAEFVQGEFFGEFEFMTKGIYDANAVASSECTLLCFPQENKTLLDFSTEFPTLYAKLIKSFLVFVARRTRNASRLLKENSPITRQLKKQLYGDKLTGVYNVTYLQENVKELLGSQASIIMFKPDNFKAINDELGHDAGDAVLVLIGKLLHQEFSKASTVIRYEGNEFALINQDISKDQAIALTKQVMNLLESVDLYASLGKQSEKPFYLSVSFGLAMFPDDCECQATTVTPYQR